MAVALASAMQTNKSSPIIKYGCIAICLVLAGCSRAFNFTELDSSSSTETGAPSDAGEPEMAITLFDVGQGDATLIQGPLVDGHRISLLIDAGRLDPDSGALLETRLAQLQVDALDYTVLTHFDADHMGGFVTAYASTSLLWEADCTPKKYFPTQAMLDLGASEKDTDSVLEYLTCREANAELLAQGSIVIGATAQTNIGTQIDLQGGFWATVVAGGGYVLDAASPVANVDTDNEQSLALLISGPGDFAFLITGDLTGRVFGNEDALVEQALASALAARGVDLTVLHVGHHGSATSSAPEFLQKLNPEVSLISVGENSYGHPHCETLENLVTVSGLIVQTEEGNLESCAGQGNVVVAGGDIQMHVQAHGYSIQTPSVTFSCSPSEGCE